VTPARATPLHIVESYFDIELDRSALRSFDRVSDETWIDFAKEYVAAMDAEFSAQFLAGLDGDDAPLCLYFEPRMAHTWDAAVRLLGAPTPLLGLSPDPGCSGDVSREDVSRMLSPLKKHLLIADSVYVRDSFYYCFDAVADSLDRTRWRQDPNAVALVGESVRKLKGWLPILVELRDLIESKAIVFMPYYLTPSFPYAGDSPALNASMRKLKMRARLEPSPTDQGRDFFDESEVVGAWLNSRLLGLDPVFPHRAMFDWAADLYLDEDPSPSELTSDLISLDILPFGRAEGVGLDDLMALRKNEAVFDDVRRAVVACKTYLESELGPGSSRRGVSDACGAFLAERLDACERRSILRFIDDKPAAGIGFSVAIGAALLPVAPAISLIASALLTPQLALLARRRRDPKRRAIGHLQALL
jgi:hypothetical protein